MKRYTITLGASTTVGGKVTSASSNGSISGFKIALEGDSIFCPACKSTGKILCIEPRIRELWNGKQVALEDDLCVCGCSNPPRLVPNQTLRCQNIQGGGAARSSDVATQAEAVGAGMSGMFNDKFILFNEATGQALPGTEYAIRRANGQLEFGVSDRNGCTHLLATTAQAESVDIYT